MDKDTLNTPHGLTYLIEHFQDRNTSIVGISPRNMGVLLKSGVENEPERFSGFIKTYKTWLDRVRKDLSPTLRYQRTLENIAVLCIVGDHDWETDLVYNSLVNGREVNEYLDNPSLYGPITNKFSECLGFSGSDLTKFVFEETTDN